MYSNNIVKFQESTTILNACTKKSGYLLKAPRNCIQIIYIKNSYVKLKLYTKDYLFVKTKLCAKIIII